MIEEFSFIIQAFDIHRCHFEKVTQTVFQNGRQEHLERAIEFSSQIIDVILIVSFTYYQIAIFVYIEWFSIEFLTPKFPEIFVLF